jgi:hypothetical protein
MKSRPSKSTPVLLEAVRETGVREQIVTLTYPDPQFPSKRSISLDSFKAEFKGIRDLQPGYGVKVKAEYTVIGDPFPVFRDDMDFSQGRRSRAAGPRLPGDAHHGHHVDPVEVRKLARTHTKNQIARIFDVNISTVRYYLKRCGIEARAGRSPRELTNDRRSFIREHAKTCTATQIADQLGVWDSSVRQQLKAMGIKALPGRRVRPFTLSKP